jgi:hypothetical protein
LEADLEHISDLPLWGLPTEFKCDPADVKFSILRDAAGCEERWLVDSRRHLSRRLQTVASGPLAAASEIMVPVTYLSSDSEQSTLETGTSEDGGTSPQGLLTTLDVLIWAKRISLPEGTGVAGVAAHITCRVEAAEPRILYLVANTATPSLDTAENGSKVEVSVGTGWTELVVPLSSLGDFDTSATDLWLSVVGTAREAFQILDFSLTTSVDPLWRSDELEALDLLGMGNLNAAVPAPLDAGREYLPGITVITPTGDRFPSFSLLLRWMKSQTRQPDQWIVVEDGYDQFPFVDQLPHYATYIRRERTEKDYNHTLANQLLAALSQVAHDKVLIMEDDDWYRHDYIEFMENQLDVSDIVGLNRITYYHYYSRQWKTGKPAMHTSLAQSGFRSKVLPHIEDVCKSTIPEVRSHGLVDRFVWHLFKGHKLLVANHETLNVGIKSA